MADNKRCDYLWSPLLSPGTDRGRTALNNRDDHCDGYGDGDDREGDALDDKKTSSAPGW